MTLDAKKQPIVIRKVIHKGGHHGGAWKIAYADFATAMMAFFLLLWILGFTDSEQKAAISEYFDNPSVFTGTSPNAPAAIGDGTGSSPSIIDFGGGQPVPPEKIDEDKAEQIAQQRDLDRLHALYVTLQNALEDSQTMVPYRDQLLVDIVPEGLRIQIIDKENRPMFDLGSPKLLPHATNILKELGAMINRVPNRTAITGHTDARPYGNNHEYTNWELSSDRANAARRALVAGGMQESKVGRIVGLGSSAPWDAEHPDNPINRRISIIVMTKAAESSIEELASQPGLVPDPQRLPSVTP